VTGYGPIMMNTQEQLRDVTELEKGTFLKDEERLALVFFFAG
jgi:hypothetical protein